MLDVASVAGHVLLGGRLGAPRLGEHDLGVVAGVLGLLEVLVDLVDVVLDRRQPSAQLVGLALELEPPGVELLDPASASAARARRR